MKRAVILFVLALAAGVVAQPATDNDDWSPVVYPMQRLPLTFSHQKHLARGMQCAQCHPGASSSQSAVDNLIPTEIECRACHAIDRANPTNPAKPVAACIGCHPGFTTDKPVERVYLTPPPLKFAHAAHAKQTCESCHRDLRLVDLATTRQLPSMSSCLDCHKNGGEERHCADCHLARLGGMIETQFEHGQLIPGRTGLGDMHGPGFGKDHKREASQVGATCTACHDRSQCVDCHQGVVKPMDFHPGNYLGTHAIEARRGTPDCSACHRVASFCVGCHERSGIGRRGNTQFDVRDPAEAFHPIGWASTGIGPNLHAQAARRNITACASCHRDDECLKCHSAQPGSPKASPHPPGWRGSSKCRALDRGNRRMCLRCHIAQDELGCDWSKP